MLVLHNFAPPVFPNTSKHEMCHDSAPSIPMPTEEEEAGIRRACSMAKTVLDHALSLVKVGVTTDEIDVAVYVLR